MVSLQAAAQGPHFLRRLIQGFPLGTCMPDSSSQSKEQIEQQMLVVAAQLLDVRQPSFLCIFKNIGTLLAGDLQLMYMHHTLN